MCFMRQTLSKSVQRVLAGFAAGAMLYVEVEELIPEMSQGQHLNIGTLFFALGYQEGILLL